MRISDWSSDVCSSDLITALSTDRDRHVAEVLQLGALEVVSKSFDPGWLVRLDNAVLLVEPDERAEYRRRSLEAARHRRTPNGRSGSQRAERKSVVEGKTGSVSDDHVGSRNTKTKHDNRLE